MGRPHVTHKQAPVPPTPPHPSPACSVSPGRWARVPGGCCGPLGSTGYRARCPQGSSGKSEPGGHLGHKTNVFLAAGAVPVLSGSGECQPPSGSGT